MSAADVARMQVGRAWRYRPSHVPGFLWSAWCRFRDKLAHYFKTTRCARCGALESYCMRRVVYHGIGGGERRLYVFVCVDCLREMWDA